LAHYLERKAVCCGVSFSRDIQTPPGRGPEQPALGGSAWARELDQTTFSGLCQPQAFCDSATIPGNNTGYRCFNLEKAFNPSDVMTGIQWWQYHYLCWSNL